MPTPKGEVKGDLATGGACAWGGACSGGCLLQGVVPAPGGCLLGGWVETLMMATAAGGTHPTGMHSCLIKFSSNPSSFSRGRIEYMKFGKKCLEPCSDRTSSSTAELGYEFDSSDGKLNW